MSDKEDSPKIAVGFDVKLNLGNYESMGGSCILSGVRVDATPEEINDLLDTAEITFSLIRDRVRAELHEAREAHVSERKNGVAMR